MNSGIRRAAMGLGLLMLAAGCGGASAGQYPSAWQYRLAGISSVEMEQATLAQYLLIQGKTKDEIRAMKPDQVEAARKEMTEAIKKDAELINKLKQFSSGYLVMNLNLLGARGWELVQVRPEGDGLIFVLKRPGKAEMPPMPGAGPPSKP